MWTLYQHTSPSGKVYVGVTSTKPQYRWSNGKGYISCKAFHNAIIKYGWDNIKHEIIATNLTKEGAFALEKMLIAKYKKLGMSYNIADGGQGIIGVPKSGAQIMHTTNIWKGKHIPDNIRRKMSKSKLGVKKSEVTKKKMSKAMMGNNRGNKKVYQYNLLGQLVQTYSSCIEASKSLGFLPNEISSCCRGIRQTSKGFIFLYNEKIAERINKIKSNKNMLRIYSINNLKTDFVSQ